MATTTTHDYPELENIPPAPPRSSLSAPDSTRSRLVPKWAAAIFSTFPLHTYPPAKAYSPTASSPPVEPTLYVAPHLNRDGTLSSVHEDDDLTADIDTDEKPFAHQAPAGWSSSDPIALRWQIELLFRGVDFEVRFIDPSHNWGPAKSMPFLHLPPRFRSGTPSSLLSATEIPHLIDNFYPASRPELGEKDAAVWDNVSTKLEARTWESLLRGRIMAGVLLAVLLSPQSAVYSRTESQPYLSSLLSAQLQNSFFDQQLRRISALNPSASSSSANPTTVLPGWEVGFLGWIGATTASAASALSTADLDSRGGGDTPGAALANPSVDQTKVVADAVDGLRALAARTKSQLSASSSELQFLLGAQKHTSLDALAFSVIHTILTLAATPQAQDSATNEPLRKLKEVLDDSPWLVTWSRKVWKKYVKDLDRA
ncbi:hypothetical protein EX895_004094 [Sporisorium graminicola]|uniref:Metaxin glutathione S-transferase domain-containing protein n=1 Tax=Sporisorium graminicola TaxID=280036 RepID=A0A4U7KTJ2_9BASI|nr:hypothetical protein EX895_004094 [Sporisorium graminicola]TKY87416.1 hypothetical protein EX895_004094 [Sporisorium graminicola]